MADCKAIQTPVQRHDARVVPIDSGGHRERVLARRDDLVREYIALVDQIARTIHPRLPPSFLLDDLIATGYVALVQAAASYRPKEHGGAPFSAYARVRVRGAMIESVRRRNYRDATEVERRDPSAMPELAERPESPEVSIDSARLRRRVLAAAAGLPLRQRQVLAAYYGADEPTLAEVGARMGFSASRAQQLHAAGLDGIRRLLREAV